MKDAIRQMLTLAISNATEAINAAHGRIQVAERTIEEANDIIIQSGDQRDEAQALLEIINEVLGTDDEPVTETPGMQQAIIANVTHALSDENLMPLADTGDNGVQVEEDEAEAIINDVFPNTDEPVNIINERLANGVIDKKGKAGENYRMIIGVLDDGKARTARELNAALHRPPAKHYRDSVSQWLRTLAEQGHVIDTGLTTMRGGIGGPPQKLWCRPKHTTE